MQFPNVQLYNSYIFEFPNLEKSKFSKYFSIFYFSNYRIFKTTDYSNSQLFKFSNLPSTNSQTFQSFNLRTRNFLNVRIFKLSVYAHWKKKREKETYKKWKIWIQYLVIRWRWFDRSRDNEAHVCAGLSQNCRNLFTSHSPQIDIADLQYMVPALQPIILQIVPRTDRF